MSTDNNSIQGTPVGRAFDIATNLISQGVAFTFHPPSECADGVRRWQFETFDAAGACVITLIREESQQG